MSGVSPPNISNPVKSAATRNPEQVVPSLRNCTFRFKSSRFGGGAFARSNENRPRFQADCTRSVRSAFALLACRIITVPVPPLLHHSHEWEGTVACDRCPGNRSGSYLTREGGTKGVALKHFPNRERHVARELSLNRIGGSALGKHCRNGFSFFVDGRNRILVRGWQSQRRVVKRSPFRTP